MRCASPPTVRTVTTPPAMTPGVLQRLLVGGCQGALRRQQQDRAARHALLHQVQQALHRRAGLTTACRPF